jgi:hypothetical protein
MATALQHIESHWNSTVVPSILEQYKDSGKWQAMLKAVIDQMQIAEDAAAEFMTILDFKSEVPTGDRLDFIAGLVNVTRFAGESDELFYTRFLTSLSVRNAGTPDNVIYNAAILSGDPHPQYMDEAPATFFVYDGPRPVGLRGEPVLTENGQEILTEGGDTIETEPVPTWEQGGHQLSRSQVRKLAPAGVLGLPGAVIQLADGSFIGIEEQDGHRKMFVVVADDRDITREVLLADNLGNIVITPQSVPVRVKLTGPAALTIPVIETEWNGVPVDAVRIKDLPDAGEENAYMVRDSEEGGTTRTRGYTEEEIDDLWENTPPEPEGSDNG